MRAANGSWRWMPSRWCTARRGLSALRACGATGAGGRSSTGFIPGSRAIASLCHASALRRWYGEPFPNLVQQAPVVRPNSANDAKARVAFRLDHRDLAFGEVRRTRDRMEGIAVTGNYDVAALRN